MTPATVLIRASATKGMDAEYSAEVDFQYQRLPQMGHPSYASSAESSR